MPLYLDLCWCAVMCGWCVVDVRFSGRPGRGQCSLIYTIELKVLEKFNLLNKDGMTSVRIMTGRWYGGRFRWRNVKRLHSDLTVSVFLGFESDCRYDCIIIDNEILDKLGNTNRRCQQRRRSSLVIHIHVVGVDVTQAALTLMLVSTHVCPMAAAGWSAAGN